MTKPFRSIWVVISGRTVSLKLTFKYIYIPVYNLNLYLYKCMLSLHIKLLLGIMTNDITVILLVIRKYNQNVWRSYPEVGFHNEYLSTYTGKYLIMVHEVQSRTEKHEFKLN
jgi:hypothetical protein